MFDFLAQRLDFVSYLAGFGLAGAALYAFTLHSSRDQTLPWVRIAWGLGLFAGAFWARALAPGWAIAASMALLAPWAEALATVALADFVRLAWGQYTERKVRARWITPLALVTVVVGFLSSTDQRFVSYFFALAAVIFLLVAGSILRAREGRPEREAVPLVAMAASISVFGVTGLSLMSVSSIHGQSTLVIGDAPIEITAIATGMGISALLLAVSVATFRSVRFKADPSTQDIMSSSVLIGAVFLSAAVLVGGWAVDEVGGKGLEMFLRHMQGPARTAAGVLDPNVIAELAADPSVENPAYDTIHDQLTAIADVNPEFESVYLAVVDDGQIVYLAEGEAADGNVAPPGYINAFLGDGKAEHLVQGEQVTAGSLNDQASTPVTALSPVFDESGNLVAHLGIERPEGAALDYVTETRAGALAPVMAFTLVILVFQASGGMVRVWARRISASESRFRAMIQSAPEAIFILNAGTGEIEHANEYAGSLTLSSSADLRGKAMADIVAKGEDAVQSCMATAMQTGERITRECQLNRGDGTQISAEISGVPIDGPTGKKLLVFARDITLQKDAENALRSRATFSALVSELSTDFISVMPEQIDDRVDSALEVVARYLGAPRIAILKREQDSGRICTVSSWSADAGDEAWIEALAGDEAWKRLAVSGELLVENLHSDGWLTEAGRDHLESAGMTCLRAVNLGGSVGFEGAMVVAFGEERNANLREDSAILHIIASTIRSAYDRRDTELAMRKLSLAVEQSPVGVVITDRDGRIEYVNPKFEQLTGFSFMELKGENPSIVKSSQTPAETHADLWETVLAGKEWSGEFVNRRKDGSLFHASSVISPMRDVDGKITHFVAVQEDVSAVKEAELVLRAAKKTADEANRAKSSFLATMSHEIRTPMNAIIGMAELLEDTKLSAEQDRYVSIFKSAGEGLLALINDVLDISKIEADRLEISHEPFALHDMVEKVTGIMAVRAATGEIEVLHRVAPDVPEFVVGDGDRLRQVLTNLLGNSVKFTESGHVLLDVERDPDGAPDAVKFSITDTGIGIPADKVDKVFESFSQADSSTTRKYGGTGLGLAIVQKLVRLMGGQVEVKSVVGSGSTFSFSIALPEDPSEHDHRVSIARELDGLRVLVVDDNEVNRLVVGEMLSQWGAEVVEAHDGVTALQELGNSMKTQTRFDLIVSDHRMPGMDGFEMIRRTRALFGSATELPIIMLSSDMQSAHADELSELGVADYLLKPARRADVLAAVRTAVAHKGEAAPKPRATSTVSAKPIRILLVEDSEDNRFLITRHLAKTEHTVEEAEDGKQALEAYVEAGEGAYDLVLMDMQMPVMDGYEATRAIREHEKEMDWKSTPIVALTAYALKDEKDKSMEAGCVAHVTKPVKKATLLETVSRFAGEEGGGSND